MSTKLEASLVLRRRLIGCLWVLLVVLVSQLAPANTSAQQKLNSTVEPLTINKSVPGTIPTNGSLAYSIQLNIDQYLQVQIISTQADISAIDPDGNVVAEQAGDNRNATPFSIVAKKTGEYRLILRPSDQSRVAQSFSLQPVELRTATPRDLDRIEAERLVKDALRLRRKWQTQSSDDALKKFERALKIWISLQDVDGQALALLNMGRTYESLDQRDKAIECYERTLNGGNKRRQLEALARLTSLYAIIPDSKKAIEHGQRALALCRDVQDKHIEAETRINIGDAQYIQNDLQLALEAYEQARSLLESTDDLAGKAQLETSLGYAYLSRSEAENASKSFHNAVDFSRQTNNRQLLALALRGLGSLFTRLGQPQRGLDAFRQALELVEQGEGQLLKARILAGIGNAYERLGDSDKALSYDNDAIKVFENIHHKWGQGELLMDVGRVYYFRGDNNQALEKYKQAQSLFSELSMPRYRAQTFSNIGLVYNALNDKPKALENYQKSLDLTHENDKRSYAYTLNYRGELKAADHRPAEAQTDFEEALPLLTACEDRVGEAMTLYNLARVNSDLGQLSQAAEHSDAALKIIESIRASVAGESLRSSFGASVHQQYELRVDILMKQHQEQPARRFDVAALEASERGRARSWLESFAENEIDIRAGVDQSLLTRKNSLKKKLDAVGQEGVRLHARPHTQKEEDDLVQEQKKLTQEWQEIQEQISANSERYARLPEVTALSGEQIRKLLDDNSLLLEFSLGEDRSYAWVVSKESIKSFTLNHGRVEIEKACKELYDALTAPARELNPSARVIDQKTDIDRLTQQLGALILEPFQNLLSQKRLLIVADGALQYVPFEVLRTTATSAQNSAPLLIDDHEVVYLPSASVFARQQARLANRPAAPKALAIFADPVFDNSDDRLKATRSSRNSGTAARSESTSSGALRAAGFDQGIPRLPFSYQEAQKIKALVRNTVPLVALGFDANRHEVTSGDLTQYRWLHFATHGILNSEDPELSGILLSMLDRNGKAQDGFLQLHEIYDLRLPADLIVLSACQTALGKEIRGEGLFGLTRGFMHAGARQVVSSLWKVDDVATADLMDLFYKEMLVNGRSPSAALQNAKLNLRKQKRWQKPFYWAGFIIQGN